MQFILEYWAQWAFALMGGAVLAAIPKIKALWQAVLAPQPVLRVGCFASFG